MPGSNCAIVGCPACKGRHKGLSFHSIPKENKFEHTIHHMWRSDMIAQIGRVDAGFNPDKATVCSRHFTEDCFITVGQRRKLKLGSLPTKFIHPEDNITGSGRKMKGKKRKLLKTDLSAPTKEGPAGSVPGVAVDDEMDRNIAASVLLLMSEKPQAQISGAPSADLYSTRRACSRCSDHRTPCLNAAVQANLVTSSSSSSQPPGQEASGCPHQGEMSTIVQRSLLRSGASSVT